MTLYGFMAVLRSVVNQVGLGMDDGGSFHGGGVRESSGSVAAMDRWKGAIRVFLVEVAARFRFLGYFLGFFKVWIGFV